MDLISIERVSHSARKPSVPLPSLPARAREQLITALRASRSRAFLTQRGQHPTGAARSAPRAPPTAGRNASIALHEVPSMQDEANKCILDIGVRVGFCPAGARAAPETPVKTPR